MQNHWIFNCNDYRVILRKKIKSDAKERGYRTKLAQAAGCQLAYLSHVLANHAQFTPDHAAGACDFWTFDDMETEYFMNLVQLDRAATPRLRARIDRRLSTLRRQHSETSSSRLSTEPYAKEKIVDYYLDWATSAIHVAITVPSLSDPSELSKRLGLEDARVRQALLLLQELGFAEKHASGWRSTSRFFHVNDESKFARLHHSNWRRRTNEVLDRSNELANGFHHTAVHSLSRNDFDRIRKVLAEAISQARDIVAPSPEETIACLTMDWYEL